MNNQKVFEILGAETEDFSYLLKLSGLDPNFDLIGSDFSYIDFGAYDGPILNLAKCNLQFANLSAVTSKLILTYANLEGAILPNSYEASSNSTIAIKKKVDLLKTALLSVHRFQCETTIPARISEDIFGNKHLIAEFAMTSGQESLTEDVFNSVVESCVSTVGRTGNSIEVALLYTRSYHLNQKQFPENSSEYFRTAMQSVDEFKWVSVSELDGVTKASLNKFNKTPFSIENLITTLKLHSDRVVFVMSGFPPITKEILSGIGGRKDFKLSFAFLVPSPTFELYRNHFHKQTVDLKYLQRDWKLKQSDINNFKGRLRRINFLGLIVTKHTLDSVDSFLGKPQSSLKEHFLRKLMSLKNHISNGVPLEI